MNPSLERFLSLDLPPLVAAVACALAASMAGSLLVLRRQGLFADGLSHAALPGVLAAYLCFESRARGLLLLGAIASGLALALLTRGIQRRTPLDASAALGALFPVFFAAGLFGLEWTAGGALDLSPNHVLFGQLELLFWLPPVGAESWFSAAHLARLPEELPAALATLLANGLWLAIAGRVLFAAGFDATGARLCGLRPSAFELASLALAAATAAVLFEIAGVVVALALLLGPAAAARLMTDRYRSQFLHAAWIAALVALIGYCLAVWILPAAVGGPSLSAAGGIALTSGAALALAARFGSRRRPSGGGRSGPLPEVRAKALESPLLRP